MDNGTRLLVLSILEGRHFPSRQSTNIIIDAKFDGESLSSDPVTHASDPPFNVELAWEIDRRALHFLHIKRAPLKLQAYAVNSKTGAKESIGYIILDSRQAHQEIEKAKPKWYPLLNSKYNPRPELLMCLGLERNVPQPASPPTSDQPTKKAEQVTRVEDENLQPILRNDGFYQIGPVATCKDKFLLSFTVGFAANLHNLISTNGHLVDENRGYFFYYSLLGNDIVTDQFRDLNLDDFNPERASIKLRSSLPALRAFFFKQHSVQVHLCSGNSSLGSAVVPLDNFIKLEDKDKTSLPLNMEDCYEIQTSRHSQLDRFPEEMKPIVGIAVCLKEEPDLLQAEVREVVPKSLNTPTEPKKEEMKVEQLSPPEKLGQVSRSGANIIPKTSQDVAVDDQDQLSVTAAEKPRHVEPLRYPNQKLNSYELTIDLKSVKNVSSSLMFATVRYSWPYFGKVAPLVTDPPLHVTPDTECQLPQGTTTVSFATLPSQMKNIFGGNPIPVELLDREVGMSRKTVLGKGAIILSQLINFKPTSTVNESGKKVERWTHSQTVSVEDVGGHRVAEIKVRLTLDDLGFFESKDIDLPSRDKETGRSGFLKRSEDIDPDIAEHVAMELEQWKEWQEEVFRNKLKEREKEQMERLGSAWTEKETEREILFKKRLTEYNQLEEKLKKALDAVEMRERQLLVREAELQRLKTDLQCEYDRLVQEVKDVSRRVKEECAHRNELERTKAKALQEQCVKWQRQVAELEKKLELREAEFQAYKEQKERPEIRLQSQINVLNLEKAELERKNDALLRSKVHYKQQYGKCLKELARLKQAMQLEAHAELREKKKELQLIKLGLEKQANQQQRNQRGVDSDTDKQSVSEWKVSGGVEQSCLAHLLNEKEELLQTGLYQPQDAVIAQLDKEIQLVLKKMEK